MEAVKEKQKTGKPTGMNMKALRELNFVVRPIKRDGGWVHPDHDSAFINDGAKKGIVVPVMAGNILKNPFKRVRRDPDDPQIGMPYFELSENDVQELADELGLDVKELNPNTRRNYWKNRAVNLDRNGLHLNLSEVDNFINFLILASDEENIALGWSNRYAKGTYLFALCESTEELVDKVSNLEERMKAYNYLDKIKGSAEKMRDLLYVYYINTKDARKPPQTGDVDWLKNEIGRIIEDDLKNFLIIINDKDYLVKLLIQKSVEKGALLRVKHNYMLPGDDKPIGTLDDMISYLDDPKNQDVRMKLKHHLEK